LKQEYQEHIRYNPQSVHAAHILNNIHEYISINVSIQASEQEIIKFYAVLFDTCSKM